MVESVSPIGSIESYIKAGQGFYELLSGPEPLIRKNRSGELSAYMIDDSGGVAVQDPENPNASHPSVMGSALFVEVTARHIARKSDTAPPVWLRQESFVVAGAIRYAQLAATEEDEDRIIEAFTDVTQVYAQLESMAGISSDNGSNL